AGGGAEQLRTAIKNAIAGIEYFAMEVWTKARNNPDARARALEDAARLIAKIENPTKRDMNMHALATGLGVDVQIIRSAVSRAAGQPARSSTAAPAASQNRHPNAPAAEPSEREKTPGPPPIE